MKHAEAFHALTRSKPATCEIYHDYDQFIHVIFQFLCRLQINIYSIKSLY